MPEYTNKRMSKSNKWKKLLPSAGHIENAIPFSVFTGIH